MNYWISYPIGFACDLGCGYCFHKSSRADDNLPVRVQPSEFALWKDTHLTDARRIIVHPHGGEPFHPVNLHRLIDLLDVVPDVEIDLLTNGLVTPTQLSAFLHLYASRIERVGFTLHRASGICFTRFARNVLYTARCLGEDRVYVKELLLPEYWPQIARSAEIWGRHGIRVRIQDFHGWNRGRDSANVIYTTEQIRAIDPEYLHPVGACTCREGFKTLLIRGGWQDGDVLLCWEDPVAVGNVHDNTYSRWGRVCVDENGRREVLGVVKRYVGTYERDLTPAVSPS